MMNEETIKNHESNPEKGVAKKDDLNGSRKNGGMNRDNIKPGGLTDGMMKDETKTEIKNQKVSEDPSTVNDIFPEEPEPDIDREKEEPKKDEMDRSRKFEDKKAGEIKPGGLTDGMMRDETKTEIQDQKVSEDPTNNEILTKDLEEK